MLESRHCGPRCRSGEIDRRKGFKILHQPSGRDSPHESIIRGDVAKLAYAQDLKSCDLNGRVGSIPTIPTTLNPLDMGLLSSSHRRPAFTGLTLVYMAEAEHKKGYQGKTKLPR